MSGRASATFRRWKRRGKRRACGTLHAEAMAIKMIKAQGQLDLRPVAAAEEVLPRFDGRCALEDDDFPFELISDVAEAESWRKEINRPTYHIHKWWAQRLGTVFRAIVLGALSPSGADILKAFYRPVRLKGMVVFDPFMGSGTTIGEALKLGARAIGRDVNPVAYFLVRNALTQHDSEAVLETFRAIEGDVARKIKAFYKTGAGRRHRGGRAVLFLGQAGRLSRVRIGCGPLLVESIRAACVS